MYIKYAVKMISTKQLASKVIPSGLWRWLRTRSILSAHRRTASICDKLIEDFSGSSEDFDLRPKKVFDSDRIIWQYWAQGYDELPEVVRMCLDSVERFSKGYTVVRLCDSNLYEYLDIPEYVERKRSLYSKAHFSDLLRLLLLSTYGGIWLDATVMLSRPIPDEYSNMDYFMFQRDPHEIEKKYWEGTYAYYFGWEKGYRVNVLNSFISAQKGSIVVNELATLLLKWWKENDSLPDYFFFQILYDVLINGRLKEYKCHVVSDCLPHYLQQSINDPNFNLLSREEILSTIPIHKLTYKKQ